jgi:broad specificity phosphatase PhoE
LALQELEQRHTGQHILLVGHGDTLSILQATFLRTPLSNHRHYALDTAELKRLNVRGGAGVAGGAVGYEAAAAAAAEAAQQQQQPALVG